MAKSHGFVVPVGLLAQAGPPTGTAPEIGDSYFDTTIGHIQTWDGTQWVTGVGPTGPTGLTGPDGQSVSIGAPITGTGPPGTAGGSPGEVVIDGDGNIWTWNGTSWVNSGNILGPTGPSGADGTIGVDGATGATGPAGPNAVSVDPGNEAVTGADGLLFVPAEVIVADGPTEPIDPNQDLELWLDPLANPVAPNYGLDDLSDVDFGGVVPADDTGLVYDATASQWKSEPVWKSWTGTRAAYDALGTYDPGTLYAIVG